MSYLETLAQNGIKASIRPGDILWLEPKSALTDDIRQMVRENRAAIIEDIRRAEVPTPTSQQETAEHLFPRDGEWRSTKRVTPEAIAQIDAVREEAIELGWTEAGLYQNRGRHPFPLGQDYGLVCFLSGSRRVGKVTREHIEIVCRHPSPEFYRHYNPDVPQPWAVRTDLEKSVRQSTTLSGKLR